MRIGAAFETRLLSKRLQATVIDRPIFITGLARSGTTMLLELLAQVDGVVTHRYRDFPFLLTPYTWNRFVNLFGRKSVAKERPHQDGIQISPESPEAFEEPIWQQFFTDAHKLVESHVLDSATDNEIFNYYFLDHIKKMLLIRGGQRYVSKGNYNVTRIEYLAELFSNARFIVPIRHPLTHVASLIRQHKLFCEYDWQDERVPQYLEAAGHFEFGPQRVPISVNGSGDRTVDAWDDCDEALGYAIQWAAVYGYLQQLLDRSPELARRVLVIRYEDLCDNPHTVMQDVLHHADLADEGVQILTQLDHIKPAKPATSDDAETIWRATADVATKFGYKLD